MPRCARVKGSNYTYHIISRSISEVNLFRDDEDKNKYIELLKKYKVIFNFSIYAYCIMDTHVHLLIYSNGADISKIMHGINQSYSQYYNRKYSRHGHLFQERFKSIVVDNSRYLFVLSLYIHKNPKSLKNLKSISDYEFSSLSVYLGLKSDRHNLVNSKTVLQRLSKKITRAQERYRRLFDKYKYKPEDEADTESFDLEIIKI
jgi:Transposase and inactivated derivatives